MKTISHLSTLVDNFYREATLLKQNQSSKISGILANWYASVPNELKDGITETIEYSYRLEGAGYNTILNLNLNGIDLTTHMYNHPLFIEFCKSGVLEQVKHARMQNIIDRDFFIDSAKQYEAELESRLPEFVKSVMGKFLVDGSYYNTTSLKHLETARDYQTFNSIQIVSVNKKTAHIVLTNAYGDKIEYKKFKLDMLMKNINRWIVDDPAYFENLYGAE